MICCAKGCEKGVKFLLKAESCIVTKDGKRAVDFCVGNEKLIKMLQ